ncbi:MAG: hypothetical protein QOE23_2788 [Pseudonocardiales bacterium]|nr:hypothetical protein [Pseudonocardiales bacterium]
MVFAVCAVGSYLIAPISTVLAHGFTATSKPAEQVEDGRFTSSADVVAGRGGAGKTAFIVLIPRGWLHSSSGDVEVWSNCAVPGASPGQSGASFERVAITSVSAAVTAASRRCLLTACPRDSSSHAGMSSGLPHWAVMTPRTHHTPVDGRQTAKSSRPSPL